MDVTGWLRATPRPLVVTARDVAVERLARRRRWEFAAVTADADMCGTLTSVFDAAVERVWSQVPAPRARADIRSADGADGELDRARDRRYDPESHRVETHVEAAGQSASRPRPSTPMQSRPPPRPTAVGT